MDEKFCCDSCEKPIDFLNTDLLLGCRYCGKPIKTGCFCSKEHQELHLLDYEEQALIEETQNLEADKIELGRKWEKFQKKQKRLSPYERCWALRIPTPNRTEKVASATSSSVYMEVEHG